MKLFKFSALVIALVVHTRPDPSAQGFQIGFGKPSSKTTDLPVEITADALSLNQNPMAPPSLKEMFVIIQGTMRMSAPLVTVFYDRRPPEGFRPA